MKQSSNWWQLLLSYDPDTYPTPEDASYAVMELGAGGAEQLPSNRIRAFAESSDNTSPQSKFDELPGITVESAEKVDDHDWVGACKEMWEHAQAGLLEIVPVDSEFLRPKDSTSTTLYITPGTGFGTGHHSSTRMALEFLQDDLVKESRPATALDLGTGSGILAIAAGLLYEPKVIAVDNDPMALENAEINVKRHNLAESTELSLGTIDDVPHTEFDLILANIYAEVLGGIEDAIHSRLTSGGFLILSGIAHDNPTLGSRVPLMKDAYPTSRWKEIGLNSSEGWCAMLLQKV